MAVLLKLIPSVPIPLFYNARKKYDDHSGFNPTDSNQQRREWYFGSNDIAAQISRILDKIKKLTQQLKELANSPGSTDEKKKQQELIQTQIKVLQAQLAALQRQQAEEAQKKQDQKLGKVEGVNSPSDNNQIDIYI
jgi:chromosome segregation ATPase